VCSCAVSRSRNCGISAMLGVRLDGLDHRVEFVGAVDLPRNADNNGPVLAPTMAVAIIVL